MNNRASVRMARQLLVADVPVVRDSACRIVVIAS